MDDIRVPIPPTSTRFLDLVRVDMWARGYALNALMYLYTKYFGREAPQLSFSYAKPTRRLPTVLTHDEAKAIISHLSGTPRLMAEILYGSGLRLHECLVLRIKDIDFALNTITVRQGKGD